MKFFGLFLVILAVVSSAMALKNEVCGLPHFADGHPNGMRCMALFQVWSYKKDTNACELFNYGGCGGNENRFNSKEECELKCKE